MGAKKQVVADAPGKNAAIDEVMSAVLEVALARPGTRPLKGLAKMLFQMGLSRGLSRDQALLQAGESGLPALVTDKGQEESMEWSVEAYRECLGEQVK